MEICNLSQLALSPIFISLLEKQGIPFDHIFSDKKDLIKNEEYLLNKDLNSFFNNKNSGGKALFLLNQISSDIILPYIQDKFEKYHIISAWSGISSFGKKIAPEIYYLDNTFDKKLKICFPFDLDGLLKNLSGSSSLNIVFNIEVPKNKYENLNNEELQIIDKILIEEDNVLQLLSSDKPNLLLIGMGNHFEELIKLSQLLNQHKHYTSFYIIGEWNLIFSERIKTEIKKVKKIGIIIDHQPNDKLLSLSHHFGKKVYLITPEYNKLKSLFPEYQMEETLFDAKGIFNKILHLD